MADPYKVFMIDERLLEYATEAQARTIQLINELGSAKAAADKLGIHISCVYRHVDRVKLTAAKRGYSPEHGYNTPAPPTHLMKGVSTLYDADGNVKLQWTKSQIDEQRRWEIMRDAIEGLVEDVHKPAPVDPPEKTAENLLNLYTMTDCHMGMLSWPKETGEAWDIKIAESVLWGAFKAMVDASPPAKTCVINQLGDFLHSDGMLPVTPTSGHILDQDCRFAKVVSSTLKVLRKLVEYALTKHEHVHVLMAEGNHDITSSIWLRVLFTAIYEKEPRVTVDDSEMPYYTHRHGKTLLAFHHGHKMKIEKLPLFFASQFSEDWGKTKHRYCHVGHMHHLDSKDHNGMRVTQHPTLAARDAYASRHGYVAPREATAITYHDVYGQVGTYTITPEMLK